MKYPQLWKPIKKHIQNLVKHPILELFAKIVNGFQFLTILAKSSNLDVSQNSDFAFEGTNDSWKKLQLFWKSVGYLFYKSELLIPPFIEQYIIVHGHILVTLCSTNMLNNKFHFIKFPPNLILDICPFPYKAESHTSKNLFHTDSRKQTWLTSELIMV